MRVIIVFILLLCVSPLYAQLAYTHDKTVFSSNKTEVNTLWNQEKKVEEKDTNIHKTIFFNTGILIKLVPSGYIGLYANVEYKPFKKLALSLLSGIEACHKYYELDNPKPKNIQTHYSILAQIPLGMGWNFSKDISKSKSVYITVSPFIHTFKQTLSIPSSSYTIQRKSNGWNLGTMYSYSQRLFSFQWHIGLLGLDKRRNVFPFWNLKFGISI